MMVNNEETKEQSKNVVNHFTHFCSQTRVFLYYRTSNVYYMYLIARMNGMKGGLQTYQLNNNMKIIVGMHGMNSRLHSNQTDQVNLYVTLLYRVNYV